MNLTNIKEERHLETEHNYFEDDAYHVNPFSGEVINLYSMELERDPDGRIVHAFIDVIFDTEKIDNENISRNEVELSLNHKVLQRRNDVTLGYSTIGEILREVEKGNMELGWAYVYQKDSVEYEDAELYMNNVDVANDSIKLRMYNFSNKADAETRIKFNVKV